MHKCLFLIALSFLCSNVFSQQKQIDSLRSITDGNFHDTIRLNAINELLVYLPPNEVELYNRKMIEIAKNSMKGQAANSLLWEKYLAFLMLGYYHNGVILHSRNQTDSSIFFFDKCVSFNNVSKNREIAEIIAYCQFSKANILVSRGLYKNAIVLLYNAIKSFDVAKNNEGKGGALSSLANLYNIQQNNKAAIEYYKKAYSIHEADSFYSGMITSSHELGLLSTNLSKRDAIYYLKKSIDLTNKFGENDINAQLLLNHSLAYLAFEQDNLEKTIYYCNKAIETAIQLNRSNSLPSRYYLLARVYHKQNKNKEAIRILELAKNIVLQNKDIDSQMKVYGKLAAIYKSSRDYKSALRYQELFMNLKDSLLKEEGRKQVLEQQLQYEFEKKEIIATANHEKKLLTYSLIADKKANRKDRWLLLLIAGFIIFSIVFYFVYKNQRQKTIIESQHSSLLKQKMLLSQMNPHFVFNSINSIQSFILDKKEKEAYSYLAKFSKLIRIVLNNTEELAIPLYQEIDLLNTYVELEKLRFKNSFVFELILDKSINEQALFIPPMLIQPYVENAIWHGLRNLKNEREGILKVCFSTQNNLLKIVVEDNGIGRARSQSFEKDAIHHPVAMKLTEKRLQMINKTWGQNSIEVKVHDLYDADNNPSGTRVELFLPLDYHDDRE